MRLRTLCLALALALALALCALPASASAAPRFERLAGFHAPGTPAKYNKVGVLKVGPKSAKNILVLNPGTSASAAYFAPLAEDIVRKAKGWQVWAVERRENLLEDHSALNRAKTGQITGQQLFDYYLGWITDSSIADHFQFIPDAQVAYARGWGMRVEIEDLRRVVKSAQRVGDHVVVGGHSLGGSITTAYATWNFGGKPGGRGLSGLVFIDGGSSPMPISRDAAEQALKDFDEAPSPWLTFGGIQAPYTGLFNSTGASGVIMDPDSPSIGQAWPTAARQPEAPDPGHERRGVRLRARHRDLAARPHRGAGPPRPPRDQRKPRRLGQRGRAHAAQALRAHVLGLGPEGTRRDRVVSPAAAYDRLGSRGRG